MTILFIFEYGLIHNACARRMPKVLDALKQRRRVESFYILSHRQILWKSIWQYCCHHESYRARCLKSLSVSRIQRCMQSLCSKFPIQKRAVQRTDARVTKNANTLECGRMKYLLFNQSIILKQSTNNACIRNSWINMGSGVRNGLKGLVHQASARVWLKFFFFIPIVCF